MKHMRNKKCPHCMQKLHDHAIHHLERDVEDYKKEIEHLKKEIGEDKGLIKRIRRVR